MKLTIKTKDRKSSIEIDSASTISDLKQEIEKIFPDSKSSSMRLIHAGKFLNDDKKTIADVNLTEEAVVYVTMIRQTVEKPPVEATRPVQQTPQGENTEWRNMMTNQFNRILEDPSLIDSLFGSQMVGKTEEEKAIIRESMLKQFGAIKENPEIMDSMFEQFKNMDPQMIESIYKAYASGDSFANPMSFPNTVPPGVMPKMNQQMYRPNVTEPSPSIPCSHGYYPYGYIGPQIVNQPVYLNQPITKPAETVDYEKLFSAQLEALKEMGFTDHQSNIQALIQTGGDVQGAANLLLDGNKKG